MGYDGSARRYDCFTSEQQKVYDQLPPKYRKYIDCRGQGIPKAQSYILAGYSSTNAAQSAYTLEKRNAFINELVTVIANQNKVAGLSSEDSPISKSINALAKQQYAESALSAINNADPETARRIEFYNDIINGRIKSVRVIKEFSPEDKLLKKKVEELDDIDVRIKARKELDQILGLNKMINLDKLNVGGDITINIVDASIGQELKDDRDNDLLNPDKVQVIDGETVFVQSEEIKGGKRKEKK